MSIIPSNLSAGILHAAISRIHDGGLAENWNETDDLGLLQQLGVIPV